MEHFSCNNIEIQLKDGKLRYIHLRVCLNFN